MSASLGKLRIGMIGAGFIAQVAHLHAFSRTSQAHIVALAETDDYLRTEVAKQFGIEHATPDYSELLRRTDIDAVVVCLPRRAQSLVVAEALCAGHPVLSEKPMAMTLDEARCMASLAGQQGVQWMIGYMKQFDHGVLHFKKLLSNLRESGDMGEILSASMHDYCATYGVTVPQHVRRRGPRTRRYAEAPIAPNSIPVDYRADYEYTVNVASHDINLLRSFFDNDISATSLVVRRGGAQQMLFDAGCVPVTLVVAPIDVGRWDQRLDVNFKRGRLSLTLPSPLARDHSAIVHMEREGVREEMHIRDEKQVWAFEAQARVFVDAALSGATPPNSGAACLADLAIIDALWKKMEFR